MKRILEDKSGFTLIEFVIILVILILLAYIAFPNIHRTYMSENEKSIKIDLRTFYAANEAFRKAQIPSTGYAAGIRELINPNEGPSYLDASWSSPTRHGFRLAYGGGGKEYPESYSLLAVPVAVKKTAKSSYCIDQKGALLSSSDSASELSGSPEGCVGGETAVG
ncbi:MAG TPA: hypothetical protein VD913_02330 [bacterium]|nr:hypothetical protein [bacterium]